MFSSISLENTDNFSQAHPNEDFVKVETPQFGDFDLILGWNYKTMNLEEAELPGEAHIKQLLGFFINQTCNASSNDPRVTIALDASIDLLQRDHTVVTVDNTNAALTTYYPASIAFINGELSDNQILFENPINQQELTELVHQAHRARCRQRFPVSVIMCNGKVICRSATLSGCGEVYGRMALDMIRPANVLPPVAQSVEQGTSQPGTSQSETSQPGTSQSGISQPGTSQSGTSQPGTSQSETSQPGTSQPEISQPGTSQQGTSEQGSSKQASEEQASKSQESEEELAIEEAGPSVPRVEEWKILAGFHVADIRLLKKLKVGTIVDLMVENRKYKLGLPVTSSEKYAEGNKYQSNFQLLSLPFPGCEFFREFHRQSYEPRGLHFDWTQPMCDAELNVPEYPPLDYLNIDWGNYKEWDLVQMTQNYIKYIIKYLEDNDEGILIHCISGWDRTPLFISLLRISLWADGLIHKSLDSFELLYLTLAYDWMLFGHHLADRLHKNEDILLFCFTMLKYLADDEFSIRPNLILRRTERFPLFDDNERQYVAPPFLGGFLQGGNDPANVQHSPASSVVGEASPPGGRSPPVPMEEELEEGDGVQVLYDQAQAMDPEDRLLLHEQAALALNEIAFAAQGDGLRVLYEEGRVIEEVAYAQGDIPPVLYVEEQDPDEVEPADDVVCDRGDGGGLYDEARALEGSVRGSDNQSEGDTASSHGTSGDFNTERKVRLALIRRLFYRCYYQTLSDRHVNYIPNPGVLSTIMNNLAELAQVLGQLPNP